mmetsp:Transcript_3947/g.13498  ORF Transcript_3947/g.13498 Transcript_3947/m.13498 type:complete len:335 (+) Transcript_3947:41-1045(+)
MITDPGEGRGDAPAARSDGGARATLLGDGGDDVDELGLHGRAADEEAVDVGLGGEVRRVGRVGRAAVLDADLVGGLLVDGAGDPVADGLVRLLGLLGRRRDARADGPDGLVGDDDARLVLEALEDGNDVLELAHALGEDGVDALLADGQRLADAEDAGEAVLEDVRELGGHERVRLRGRGQAELAAALAVADEHRVHAHVLDLVHGHLARVGAAAAEVAVLRRDLDAGLEGVLDEGDVEVRRADVDVALVEVGRAAVEVGHELRQARRRRRVALPVPADDGLAGHAAHGAEARRRDAREAEGELGGRHDRGSTRGWRRRTWVTRRGGCFDGSPI